MELGKEKNMKWNQVEKSKKQNLGKMKLKLIADSELKLLGSI